MLSFGALLLAVLTATAGEASAASREVPLPHPDQEWIRATSPSFTIISSAGVLRTQEVADTLETVAGALRRIHPRFDARFADTTVFLFSRRRDSQPYFELLLNQRRTSAPGAFVVQPDGSAAIIVDATRPVTTSRTVKHELMHNILSASGTTLPLWLEEGIAEFFSTTVVRGQSVIVGRPIVAHQMSLRRRGVLPMEDVIAARPGSPVATHVLFYPQSWAIVEWMMRTNRRAFYAFVADVEQGAEVTAAFRRHFTIDIDAVARSFRSTAVRPSASSAMQVERVAVPVKTAKISAADALHELGTFLGRMTATRDDAERYLRAALDLDPDHAPATAGMGTLRAYENRWDEAAAFFEQALTIAPGDLAVSVAYAEALLRNAIGPLAAVNSLDADAPSRYRRARQLVDPALKAGASPVAEAIAGASYLVEEDVGPGVELLERAHAARPGRVDFALNLYAMYLRTGRRGDAEALFAKVFERARNPQAPQAARAIFVRENLLAADRLVREQRIDEAIGVLQEIIAVTPDPAAREDLRGEADKLAQVAETNRAVVAYNEAVDAFNSRADRAALDHLDRLLAFATDPGIRERAERLRGAVRKRLGM